MVNFQLLLALTFLLTTIFSCKLQKHKLNVTKEQSSEAKMHPGLNLNNPIDQQIASLTDELNLWQKNLSQYDPNSPIVKKINALITNISDKKIKAYTQSPLFNPQVTHFKKILMQFLVVKKLQILQKKQQMISQKTNDTNTNNEQLALNRDKRQLATLAQTLGIKDANSLGPSPSNPKYTKRLLDDHVDSLAALLGVKQNVVANFVLGADTSSGIAVLIALGSINMIGNIANYIGRTGIRLKGDNLTSTLNQLYQTKTGAEKATATAVEVEQNFYKWQDTKYKDIQQATEKTTTTATDNINKEGINKEYAKVFAEKIGSQKDILKAWATEQNISEQNFSEIYAKETKWEAGKEQSLFFLLNLTNVVLGILCDGKNPQNNKILFYSLYIFMVVDGLLTLKMAYNYAKEFNVAWNKKPNEVIETLKREAGARKIAEEKELAGRKEIAQGEGGKEIAQGEGAETDAEINSTWETGKIYATRAAFGALAFAGALAAFKEIDTGIFATKNMSSKDHHAKHFSLAQTKNTLKDEQGMLHMIVFKHLFKIYSLKQAQ